MSTASRSSFDAPAPPEAAADRAYNDARNMDRSGASLEPPIRITGLAKAFRGHLGLGRRTALAGLDLEVRRGEVFGLLGPNGAGKTTALKLLIGLLRADAGEVRLWGRPSRDPAVRARLGYLPENPYFYDYLTAEEFLDFYGRLQGIEASERAARVASTLERVGLGGRERTALRKFSKGMIQRVGIAQAIQHDPDLVILDEPMSGLDPLGRRQVRDLILDLRARGRTVLFSSHILQDAEMVCDRVGILVGGKLRALGPLRELVSPRIHWFEIACEGVEPEGWPAEIVHRDGRQCLLRVSDVDALSRVLAAVRSQGGSVSSIWPRRDTLEDLFLEQVTGKS